MERLIRGLLVGAVALSALAVSAGCGPTQSTALIIDADVQLQAARTADAPKLSPYEFTAAEAYLHKAREEQGYSDFEVAIDFADKASKFAREAKEKAMAARAEGAVPPPPPDLVIPKPPEAN
jgi:hypothetical protein